MPRGVFVRTEEHKRNIGLAMKGKKPWITGKHHTKESIELMRTKALLNNSKPPINSGKNHGMWKGGVTKLVIRIRSCTQSKKWRQAVLIRDNFKCILCGSESYLDVDHYPKSFAEIYYQNDIKTLQDALECKEFWNINNGRIICRSCHKKTGSWSKHYCLPIYM